MAVNINESDAAQDFTVAGAAVDVATPWVTSDTLALAAQTPVSVVAGAFSYTLPARSVTTFVADPAVPTN